MSVCPCDPQTKGIGRTGTRNDKTHAPCRRCGKPSYHIQKAICACCGYGKTPKFRRFDWSAKAKRRRTDGTGRTRHLKTIARKAKNGFRESESDSSHCCIRQTDFSPQPLAFFPVRRLSGSGPQVQQLIAGSRNSHVRWLPKPLSRTRSVATNSQLSIGESSYKSRLALRRLRADRGWMAMDGWHGGVEANGLTTTGLDPGDSREGPSAEPVVPTRRNSPSVPVGIRVCGTYSVTLWACTVLCRLVCFSHGDSGLHTAAARLLIASTQSLCGVRVSSVAQTRLAPPYVE